MISKLCFFYGRSFDEIENMEPDKAEAMWLAITQIEAQEQLKKMTIADWPKLGKKDRIKIHKELFNQAYPNSKQKKNFISAEQLQKMLGR